MPVIRFKHTMPVCQVEVPASVGDPQRAIERSHDGAIHVSPGGTKTVTQDELDVMYKDPVAGKHIEVLIKDEKAFMPASAQQLAEAAARAALLSPAVSSTAVLPAAVEQASVQPESSDKPAPKAAKR